MPRKQSGKRKPRISKEESAFIDELGALQRRIIAYVEDALMVHADLYGPESLAPSRLPLDFLVDVSRLFVHVSDAKVIPASRRKALRLDDPESPCRSATVAGVEALANAALVLLDIEGSEGGVWLPPDLDDDTARDATGDVASDVLPEILDRYCTRCVVEAALRLTEIARTRERDFPVLDLSLQRGCGHLAYSPIEESPVVRAQISKAMQIVMEGVVPPTADGPPPGTAYH